MTTLITLVALIAFAASASGQTPPGHPWSQGTTIQVHGGAATAEPSTTGTFGAAAGWEITHRVALEGSLAWLWQRRGAEGFAADLRLLYNLTRPAPLVPYLGAGMGLYRSSFDLDRSTVPDFYQRTPARAALARRVSYTDPTAVLAAGVNAHLSTHVTIRPEATLRLVVDNARTYRVTAFTVAFVYHVEDHVSSDRRRTR